MNRYICVHGHFYQPPREHPWLEQIALQDSAAPYHDWNERITAECYAPNAASRILDDDDWIIRIVNNYESISFNFGPTLLAWMQLHAKKTYAAVLEADRVSARRFSGHGSAIAQAMNHIILPLANRRDKKTQILWGLADFEHRFGRKAEGMWLAETAVDRESLDLMAEAGVKFTILAPHQAANGAGGIDPTKPYRVSLESGRSIAVFFYDGPISRAVAFEDLLKNGERFAQRMMHGFSADSDRPQLVHIATDGETYGHHQRHGDMALAYMLHHVEAAGLAKLTNYGEYLERFPPEEEVEIVEDSSWSCVHGIERWRSNCGCNSGQNPDWSQEWRAPLREALDNLRDAIAPRWQESASALFRDPWTARDEYIDVVLDRSPTEIDRFLAEHVVDQANHKRTDALELLEIQRNCMLMYTSCGWFFDELSGLETVQVLRYAARVLELAKSRLGIDLTARFRESLARAESNLPAEVNGDSVFLRRAVPIAVSLDAVMAQYVVNSLFDTYAERASLYCFDIVREDLQSFDAGSARLIVGRGTVNSTVTDESGNFTFTVLHLGDHNLNAGVRRFVSAAAYANMLGEVSEPFRNGDTPATVRAIDRHFDSVSTLESRFLDDQRRCIQSIIASNLDTAEIAYQQIYDQNASLMRFVTNLAIPLPEAFRSAAELVLHRRLLAALDETPLPLVRIEAALNDARDVGVRLENPDVAYSIERALTRAGNRLVAKPLDLATLTELDETIALIERAKIDVDLWVVQNRVNSLAGSIFPEMAEQSDDASRAWTAAFRALLARLNMREPA